MKCPLFTIGRTDVQMGVESDYGECLREGCAWWDKLCNSCAVLQLSKHLESINFDMRSVTHDNR